VPIIVGLIEIDGPEQLKYGQLFAPRNILLQRNGDGLLFGRVAPDTPRFIDQTIVNCQIGRHSASPRHV
jgi:hypothetical protein